MKKIQYRTSRPKRINYNATFACGDATEQDFALKIMSNKDYDPSNITITTGDFPFFDIRAYEAGFLPTTFEVKTSSEVTKYNSHFLELEQSGKKSGFQLSTADEWIFYGNDYKIYNISKSDIISFIHDNKPSLRETKYRSDSGWVSARGYVIPNRYFSNDWGTHDINITKLLKK